MPERCGAVSQLVPPPTPGPGHGRITHTSWVPTQSIALLSFLFFSTNNRTFIYCCFSCHSNWSAYTGLRTVRYDDPKKNQFSLCLSTSQPESTESVFRVFCFLSLHSAARQRKEKSAQSALSVQPGGWSVVLSCDVSDESKESSQRQRYAQKTGRNHFISSLEDQNFALLCALSGKRYVYTFQCINCGAGQTFGDISAVALRAGTPHHSK